MQTTVHDTTGFRGLMPRLVRASVTAVSITCVAPTVDVPTLHLLLSRGADANVKMVVRHAARVRCCVVSPSHVLIQRMSDASTLRGAWGAERYEATARVLPAMPTQGHGSAAGVQRRHCHRMHGAHHPIARPRTHLRADSTSHNASHGASPGTSHCASLECGGDIRAGWLHAAALRVSQWLRGVCTTAHAHGSQHPSAESGTSCASVTSACLSHGMAAAVAWHGMAAAVAPAGLTCFPQPTGWPHASGVCGRAGVREAQDLTGQGACPTCKVGSRKCAAVALSPAVGLAR